MKKNMVAWPVSRMLVVLVISLLLVALFYKLNRTKQLVYTIVCGQGVDQSQYQSLEKKTENSKTLYKVQGEWRSFEGCQIKENKY